MRIIARRSVLRQVVVIVAVSILWTWGMVGPDDTFADTDACKLLSAGEIEAVVGEKVTFVAAKVIPELCNIQIGNGPDNLKVHFFKKTPKTAEAEKYTKQGEEMAKKRGIKGTVEKHGNTTCTTSAPPAPPQKILDLFDFYNTTCQVDKGGSIVVLMVYRISEKKMVPISKLRPLAEKAASRL